MVYLKSLSIKHFKGFSEGPNEFSFAIPNGQAGSGLTVIVGPNNSGKSTVFDALLKLSEGKEFPETERVDGRQVLIAVADSQGGQKVITNASGGSQIEIDGSSRLSEDSFQFVAPRRHWDARFGGGTVTYTRFAQSEFRIGRSQQYQRSLGGLIFGISRSAEEKKLFCDLMQRLIRDFDDWAIDTADEEGRHYVKYITRAGTVHHAGQLGDGIMSLFTIVAHLCRPRENHILLMDEPELSFHPQAQKRLAALLADRSDSKQIIVSTHSPHFVRWADMANGAQVIRLQKKPHEGCRPYALGSPTKCEALIGLAEDWQKPYLLDAVAKEIFFAENVVFVEGQEDMSLIRRYITDRAIEVNFDIFGYGAGGSGNIKAFLRMSKDLGLSAGAIFDGTSSEEMRTCRSEFPEFHVRQISKPDIRDKYERDETGREVGRLISEGLFDRHGTLKPEAEDELEELIRCFIEHFDACS